MTNIGIRELTLDQLTDLVSETQERGIYERLFEGLLESDAPAQSVMDRFKNTKPDSVYQGFRKQVKDNPDRFGDLAVLRKDDTVIIYKRSALNGSQEQDEE